MQTNFDLVINYSIESLDDVAQMVLKNVKSKTILFYGSMGTGKTTLIKALVKALGITDDVSSPTYSIVNNYETKDIMVYHFDLYRVKTLEEAYNFGIEDYLNTNHWLFIEWPELIRNELADAFDTVTIETDAHNKRILTLN